MKNPVRIHEVLSKEFTAMTQSCSQSEQNQSKEKKLLVCEHGWKSRTHFVMASKGSAKQRIEHWANVPEKICYMFLCYKSVRKCTGHVVASKLPEHAHAWMDYHPAKGSKGNFLNWKGAAKSHKDIRAICENFRARVPSLAWTTTQRTQESSNSWAFNSVSKKKNIHRGGQLRHGDKCAV